MLNHLLCLSYCFITERTVIFTINFYIQLNITPIIYIDTPIKPNTITCTTDMIAICFIGCIFSMLDFNYFLSCPAVGALCVPAYSPNQAAPAPTNTEINPDCSSDGSTKSMNQNVAK